jgi:phage antirepressor YoqD-like protein
MLKDTKMDEESRELIARATQALETTSKLLEQTKAKLQEKNEHADLGRAISASDEHWDFGVAAKHIASEIGEIYQGKQLGRNELYWFCVRKEIIYCAKDKVSGKEEYLPYQNQVDVGRFVVKSFQAIGKSGRPLTNSRDEEIINHLTFVTVAKGIPYLIKKLVESRDAGTLERDCKNWR